MFRWFRQITVSIDVPCDKSCNCTSNHLIQHRRSTLDSILDKGDIISVTGYTNISKNLLAYYNLDIH